jgi:S-DNA-T family DNA segregation ATPase FtsK/SpoIIIE
LYTDRKATSIVVASCAGLGVFGAALFALLVSAAIGGGGGFGGFLLDGLSWAAFVLPAYPLVGALIIAIPGFRFDILFGLVGSLLPFASLAGTARFLDDPARWLAAYPGLRPLGAAGVSAAGFVATLATSFLVGAIARRLRTAPSSAGTSSADDDYPDQAPPRARAKERPPVIEPDEAADDEEPRVLDLSYPDLPPAPFLRSLSDAARSAAPEPEFDETPTAELEEIELLEDLDAADPDPLPTPVVEPAAEQGAAAEEPIRLMFGRGTERPAEPKSLIESDPALDADFWADADLVDAAPAEDDPAEVRRSALLPKVEIFQDGEHTDAVRDAADLAERSGRFDAAAVNPAATLVKSAAAAPPPARPAQAPVELSVPPARPPRPTLKKPIVQYSLPTEGILTAYPDGQYWIIDDKTRRAAEVLRDTLKEFGIEAEVTGIRKGPVITMFEILPAPGVRLSKIANLCDNIALRLAASSVRIVAPIPGKHAVGIEVPNERRAIVSFKEIVESDVFKNAKMEVPVVLGKDITGDVQVVELTQTPHLLIAGATGSGKSVCVNSIILSILYKRSFNEVKLILIDPKIVELKLYNGIPHLLTPVITEPKRAFQALQYCICEMERRYSLLDAMGVRDIRSFNRKIAEKNMATEKLPYIVVIIDEFADLMATTGKELESTLARLAAMSRAVGIHLVLATQRPSIDVITGLIKANIPSRIAFMVAGKFDSRIIIDMVGAEKLLGRGDMLYSSATDAFPVRMQGAFVSDDEVERVVAYVKTLGEPDYIDEEIFVDEDDDEGPSLFDEEDDDPLYEKALEIVLSQGKASASFLQRKLKIGYNRAARLVELMEEKGIVGKAQGSKPRDLMHNPEMGRIPSPRAKYVPDFTPDEEEADADEATDSEESDQ